MKVQLNLKNKNEILEKAERVQELLRELLRLAQELNWYGAEFEISDENE